MPNTSPVSFSNCCCKVPAKLFGRNSSQEARVHPGTMCETQGLSEGAKGPKTSLQHRWTKQNFGHLPRERRALCQVPPSHSPEVPTGGKGNF